MNNTVSLNDWANYRQRLSTINQKAADEFRDHFFKNGYTGLQNVTRQEMIDYAYALATKYGEGSAELACQMYDAISEMEGAKVAAAIPAQTATYGETAKAINGSLLQSPDGSLAETVVSRLVKQAGADTTIKNVKRDNAEWAWIPAGDTCAFCLAIASNGWQEASQAILKGDHAEHIHGHCDCAFAIRHNTTTQYAGYNPDKLYEQYNNAADGNSITKIKAMRRAEYAQNKDRINAQKRAAYARRKEFSKSGDQ